MEVSFEILAEIKWGEAGLGDPLLDAGAPRDPRIGPRPLPLLRIGDAGSLWLLTASGEAVRWQAGHLSTVPLAATQATTLLDIAPLADGSLVVLGMTMAENVLARLDARGQLLWRRTGPRDSEHLDLIRLQGEFEMLLRDRSGTLYLPGTRIAGQISQVNIADGSTPIHIDLGTYRARVFLVDDTLYRVQAEDGTRRWVKRSLQTGAEAAVTAVPALQNLLGLPLAALPNGGALLVDGGTLVFMGPTGEMRSMFRLAGAVRLGTELFIASRHADGLEVQHWHSGQSSWIGKIHGLAGHAWLSGADPERLLFMTPDGPDQTSQYSAVERDAKVLSPSKYIMPPGGTARLNQIDLSRPAITSDGSILFVCCDAIGTYVIRLTHPAI